MNSNIFLSRLDKLRQILANKGLDGIYLTNLTSVRYISGFTGSAGSCLITIDNSYFISDLVANRIIFFSSRGYNGIKPKNSKTLI